MGVIHSSPTSQHQYIIDLMDRTSLIILISCLCFFFLLVLLVIRVPCMLTLSRMWKPCSRCCNKDQDDVVDLLKQDGVIRVLARAAEDVLHGDAVLVRSESGYCSHSEGAGQV